MLQGLDALPALCNALETAHDADERAASSAGIAFGCTLFVSAGAADHCILLAKITHSESPRTEKIKTQLPRRLLLNLRGVSRACDVTRSRLDARLCSVDRIEAILNLQSEIIPEIVRVDEAETRAQANEPVIADLLADDSPGVEQAVEVRVRSLLCARVVDATGLKLDDVHEISRNRARQKISTIPERERREL